MNNKQLFAAGFSHIGQRTNHEDNFLINGAYLTAGIQKQMATQHYFSIHESHLSKVRIFAVSDGMGGHHAGEVASRICVEKLACAQKELQHCSSLKEAVAYLQTVITDINNTICDLSNRYKELKDMGATLVLCVVYEKEYAILNIGDSRAYYFNNQALVQVTKDHNEGQRMLDLGILSREELMDFPSRKNLNRYIGYGSNGYVLKADEYYPILDDGLILLCSDGISDYLSDRNITTILSSKNSIETAGKQIIDEAVTSYDADNATIILIPLRR